MLRLVNLNNVFMFFGNFRDARPCISEIMYCYPKNLTPFHPTNASINNAPKYTAQSSNGIDGSVCIPKAKFSVDGPLPPLPVPLMYDKSSPFGDVNHANVQLPAGYPSMLTQPDGIPENGGCKVYS